MDKKATRHTGGIRPRPNRFTTAHLLTIFCHSELPGITSPHRKNLYPRNIRLAVRRSTNACYAKGVHPFRCSTCISAGDRGREENQAPLARDREVSCRCRRQRWSRKTDLAFGSHQYRVVLPLAHTLDRGGHQCALSRLVFEYPGALWYRELTIVVEAPCVSVSVLVDHHTTPATSTDPFEFLAAPRAVNRCKFEKLADAFVRGPTVLYLCEEFLVRAVAFKVALPEFSVPGALALSKTSKLPLIGRTGCVHCVLGDDHHVVSPGRYSNRGGEVGPDVGAVRRVGLHKPLLDQGRTAESERTRRILQGWTQRLSAGHTNAASRSLSGPFRARAT